MLPGQDFWHFQVPKPSSYCAYFLRLDARWMPPPIRTVSGSAAELLNLPYANDHYTPLHPPVRCYNKEMRSFFIHTVWRVLTLVLVVLLALGTSFFFIPYVDRKLPTFPVILIVYVLVAYILIPVVVRFWRLVMKPNHIPRYATTADGWPADPVNIAIIAKSERHLRRAMARAGWYEADRSSFKNDLREAYALLFDKPYPTAPFSALYLFGRKFDIGFQMAYGKNKSPRQRHHVRFWRLVDKADAADDIHFKYWFERIKHLFGRKRTIWIGAAIDDVNPVGIRWRNLQLTHGNDSDHTLERDLIIDSLKEVGAVKVITDIKDGEPFKMRSQNIGTSFVVDGYIKVVTLKHMFGARKNSKLVDPSNR